MAGQPLTPTLTPRAPRGRGRAVSVTCQCIFFVEWENHVQVTPLDRPLPPGEGRGEGLPATSVNSISSHPLSVAVGHRVAAISAIQIEKPSESTLGQDIQSQAAYPIHQASLTSAS